MNRSRLNYITAGHRRIGDGEAVYVIAELGYNFRTLDEGRASIDAAAECGADAVKIQTFRADTVVSKSTDFPNEAGGANQFDEFKRYEISEEWHRALQEHSQKRKIQFFSTPSFYDDVDLLERLHVPLYKIGSDDLTNLPFLTYVASKRKPIIFSTGMGTLGEVDDAITAYLAGGNDQLVLLHCLSNYPITNINFLNLRAITALRSLGFPVGFSDHTTTLSASVAAVALGACVIEKHFALDKKLPVPDASFSADPKELCQLVQMTRETEQSLGNGIKMPVLSECEMRRQTRKSLIARKRIESGEQFTNQNVIIKRPGTGIPPKCLDLIIGRAAKRTIFPDEPITWDMLG